MVRPRSPLTLLLSWLLVGACGGKTTSDVAPTPTPAPTAATLRFQHIAVGHDSFCGITIDGRLACVKDSTILVDRPGPYVDVSFNDDMTGWNYRCAVLANGQLECDGVDGYSPPKESFVRVSVGFFNACALGADGRLACWLPEILGGTPGMKGVYRDFSVGGLQACAVDIAFHPSCVGMTAVDPPQDLHFYKIAASGLGACGLVLPAPGDIAGPGVWCWTKSGQEEVLTGSFQSLSVNLNGEGCVLDDVGVARCFGEQEGLFSVADGPFTDVGVSNAQACALRKDGTVDCRPLQARHLK